ncbi:MAG: V-type ATP synthase subunit E [Dehalococcoidia bacterium]|nr:V-type ATP synthase subunit E [Dehalococcoidia bacterium]
MQNISEAVVDKVRVEAQAIVSEAEEEAKKELDKAKGLRDARLDAEKRRLLTEARGEAARIVAHSAMQARQEVAAAKASIVDDMVAQAKTALQKSATKPELLAFLIGDAIDGTGSEKATVAVNDRDLSMAKELVKNDKHLSAVVIDVVATDCMGGVIATSEDKKTSVDNTYPTRLEMLLPRLLPEINKELF